MAITSSRSSAPTRFGRPEDAQYFFNYFYANLSLPEIHRYLRHIERDGRLPKKLILVQITPPNADNGRFIVNLGNELPPDMLLSVLGRDELARKPSIAAVAWELIDNWLHEVLNYNTFVLSIFQGGDYKQRTVSPANCRDETPVWPRRLPFEAAECDRFGRSIRNILLAADLVGCIPPGWFASIRISVRRHRRASSAHRSE